MNRRPRPVSSKGAPRILAVATLALAGFAVAASPGREAALSTSKTLVLRDAVRTEALPLIGLANYLGLGDEARQLDAWARDHRSPLTLRPQDLTLEDETQSRIRVSLPMARVLERLNQWYGLVATEANPITHAQLRAAALAPASVDRIRKIFEETIRRGVRVGGKWLTPEAGGEATIDTELRLIEASDPRWSTVQELIVASADPKALADLCQSRPIEVERIDPHGLLKVAIARFRLGTSGGATEVERALATLAQNAAPTYSLGPEEQFTLIATTNWHGRYVGRWHTHAPHDGTSGWAGGDVPSFEDMQNAVRDGQYLTLAFQPDGFDLYDAEALADAGKVDLSLLKVIRYRSPSWREHFRKLRPMPARP